MNIFQMTEEELNNWLETPEGIKFMEELIMALTEEDDEYEEDE